MSMADWLKYVTTVLLVLVAHAWIYSQSKAPKLYSKQDTLKVVFYNVENLFDTEDDPATRDEDFTPNGDYSWSAYRLKHKLLNICKVIIAIGRGDAPAIIGLSEIENEKVLEQLINETPLNHWPYAYIHYNSPDERGIDVALLYRSDLITGAYSSCNKVVFPHQPEDKTRDVLFVKMSIGPKIFLNLFVNHWPSRSGGKLASERNRIAAAHTLQQQIDSILSLDVHANILVMGDFNDEPHDISLTKMLPCSFSEDHEQYLVNIMPMENIRGTLKYKSHWYVFDQFLASQTMIDGRGGMRIVSGSVQVFDAGFLLTEDSKYLGVKPFRTYVGPRYLGGYSDHLPIYLKIVINNK